MKNDLNTVELNAVTRAFDAITDSYAENNKIIFASESERASQHFGNISRRLKKWSVSNRCVVPGCNSRSIVRSHTVPKGMSLKAIGENGHVLAPMFDQKLGAIKMESTGLSNATTFPGFCSTHELMFEGFENKKSIDTEADTYLQIYRVGCRELFRAQSLIEHHDWMMAEYSKTRDKGLLRLIEEQAKLNGLTKDLNAKKFTFENDPLILNANHKFEPVRELATHIEQHLLPALEKAVFQSDGADMYISAISLDLEIPVALAGAAPFTVSENGTNENVSILINIIPSTGKTLLIFGGLSSQKKYIETYQNRWVTHALNILSMIESWMINGSDQWCLKPSVWHALPASRKTDLLALLHSTQMNIGEDCGLSIFDNIRKNLIQQSNASNSNNLTDDYISFIASEQRKMT